MRQNSQASWWRVCYQRGLPCLAYSTGSTETRSLKHAPAKIQVICKPFVYLFTSQFFEKKYMIEKENFLIS